MANQRNRVGYYRGDYYPAGSTGGVTDHGDLTGREDDDHTQYHNDTRAEEWLTATTHNGDITTDSHLRAQGHVIAYNQVYVNYNGGSDSYITFHDGTVYNGAQIYLDISDSRFVFTHPIYSQALTAYTIYTYNANMSPQWFNVGDTMASIVEDVNTLGNYTTLSALDDVSITNPDSADVLTYNGSSWVNTALGSASFDGNLAATALTINHGATDPVEGAVKFIDTDETATPQLLWMTGGGNGLGIFQFNKPVDIYKQLWVYNYDSPSASIYFAADANKSVNIAQIELDGNADMMFKSMTSVDIDSPLSADSICTDTAYKFTDNSNVGIGYDGTDAKIIHTGDTRFSNQLYLDNQINIKDGKAIYWNNSAAGLAHYNSVDPNMIWCLGDFHVTGQITSASKADSGTLKEFQPWIQRSDGQCVVHETNKHWYMFVTKDTTSYVMTQFIVPSDYVAGTPITFDYIFEPNYNATATGYTDIVTTVTLKSPVLHPADPDVSTGRSYTNTYQTAYTTSNVAVYRQTVRRVNDLKITTDGTIDGITLIPDHHIITVFISHVSSASEAYPGNFNGWNFKCKYYGSNDGVSV